MPGGRVGADGLDSWGDDRFSGRSAAHRAQQRAMRGPGPSNHQSRPIGQLRRGAEFGGTSATFRPPPAMVDGLMSAWVMIFNAGQPTEGVYTQMQDGGSAVLAFECTDDANHYAQLLLERGFDLATPLHWSADRLTTFCRTSGLEVSIVPRGTVPMLPDNHFEPSNEVNQPGSTGQQGESMFESARRRDAYTANRKWLEDLFYQPNECGDDDCVLR
eukprot:7383623-Prymnesium_polylepis.1